MQYLIVNTLSFRARACIMATLAISSMLADGQNAKVQRVGCWTLANIARDDAACKQAVVSAGGPAVVVTAMQAHTADVGVQRRGCQMLANIACGDAACKQAVVAAGGPAVVVTAMQAHTSDVDLRRDGWLMLANIACGDAACKQAVVAAGGQAAATSAMQTHATNPSIQASGTSLVTNVKKATAAAQSNETKQRIRTAREHRHCGAMEPSGLQPQAQLDLNIAASTHVLYCIDREKVGQLLPASVEEEINTIVQRRWSDFSLATDLRLDDIHARKYDKIFYLRDENGDVVGFRSVKWEADPGAWIFENGVVRDESNGLGSILVQMIMRFILESSTIADDRRNVAANVELTNEANIRLYCNFKCRVKGAHFNKQFRRLPGPTKKIRKDRGHWTAFAFP